MTASGRTCQVWAASQPHQHNFTEVGEHSHCRNPNGDSEGVWCFTTDPDKEWEYCSVPICGPTMLKVLDFSADNDHQTDSNGEYTMATLDVGTLPESFTICSSIMVNAWTTTTKSAYMFLLADAAGNQWGFIDLYASHTFTEYEVWLGPVRFQKKTEAIVFPLQWVRACLSLDSTARKVTLVVDGQVLGEEEYRREEDQTRPANLSLSLGYNPVARLEYPVKIANINVFNSGTSVERMVGLTTAGGDKCGSSGDIVSWEEAEWTLHSQVKVIEVDREWEGPCRRESKVQVFTADFEFHQDCMEHCKKIADGRSPPVSTEEEWTNFTTEINLITQDISNFPYMWLSATEGGGKTKKLVTLDHWPETEVVNNETMKLEATETVWRDFHTGQRLENWTKPYYFPSEDSTAGDIYNCMLAFTHDVSWRRSWYEWQCKTYDSNCPCSYPGHRV